MIKPNRNTYRNYFVDTAISKAIWKGIPFYKRWLFNLKMWYRRNDAEIDCIGIFIGCMGIIISISILFN